MKISKSFAVGMVICFVAVITLSGVLIFRQSDDNTKEPGAQKQVSENKDKIVTEEKEQEEKEPIQEAQSSIVKNEEEETDEKTEENVRATGGNTQRLNFSASDVLSWPVDGHVILNYSMDCTVYFSTLDQYKYNPALIIGGEIGDEVIAAGSGIVKEVTETAETGLTVTIEMGNGYDAIYGQLMEVVVSPGEYIEQEETIGKLAEPSKYYSVEGCNLYFQLKKDGKPENPMEYLDV